MLLAAGATCDLVISVSHNDYTSPDCNVGGVGHSYMGYWEVVVNWLACIKLLLLSGYFRRTFDSVGALFT